MKLEKIKIRVEKEDLDHIITILENEGIKCVGDGISDSELYYVIVNEKEFCVTNSEWVFNTTEYDQIDIEDLFKEYYTLENLAFAEHNEFMNSTVTKGTEYHLEQDKVNSPSHYNQGKFEVIDVIEDWGLENDAYLFNVIKYVSRANYKGKTLEDLKKAAWYLNRKIKNLEKENTDDRN